MTKYMSGAEIRKHFIEFFEEAGHTFVPSSSLVPGGDQTLLFTNAGMVQFKDVFLGTDHRPYTRAANSQKCMRVAGKHNDLDDVGRDNTHHTFFEMLGNWSFGDYYKSEAIAWAFQLLTQVFGLPKEKLYATCFKDDQGDIPTDEEAAAQWALQPGMNKDHILFFGRKANFWEMADTGPCGPCSEIHIDRGEDACDKKDVVGHVCAVNGDCARFLEIWNLVFIQYNRLSATHLEPLPQRHVDTGMGFERLVALIQGKDSNYRTDLFWPLILKTQELARQTDEQREKNFTPYRVIADHARAAAFLIADGVVPGNTGRNYICRMIIRRAARFGSKLGLVEPFLARIADLVIENYGEFYPELNRARGIILEDITREEERFARTVEHGLEQLQEALNAARADGKMVLEGSLAFDLYATHGLPLELSRDVAQEQGMEVDQSGFQAAMEEHRLASGAGKAFGSLGGEDADQYRQIFEKLVGEGELPVNGVKHDPYTTEIVNAKIAALLHDGYPVEQVEAGEKVEVVVPETSFYLESGGQVNDHGEIRSADEGWVIAIDGLRRPASGLIVHSGTVLKGQPRVGDQALVAVDHQRRSDIRRNHTATHLLHAALRHVLGEHARQAGSLVAPDRLRFDFTHPAGMTHDQLQAVEDEVNQRIYQGIAIANESKSFSQATAEGATALFGEKYGETVRTVSIGQNGTVSYELCGGTHVRNTADIGMFLVLSEGSAAAGIRRIEAVTGRGAYVLVRHRADTLRQTASVLETSLDELPVKAGQVNSRLEASRKEIVALRAQAARGEFEKALELPQMAGKIPYAAQYIAGADADTLRHLADRFRERYPSSVVLLAGDTDGKPLLIAAVSEDLVKRGLHAGDIVKRAAAHLGGGGGGRPTLAQAGGRDLSHLQDALAELAGYLNEVA